MRQLYLVPVSGCGVNHAAVDQRVELRSDARRYGVCLLRGGRPRQPPLAGVERHLLSVTPTAHWLEYADWWNPILIEPLSIENGMAIPGESGGSGMEWDEAAVGRFAV
jgi:hypothetical protein